MRLLHLAIIAVTLVGSTSALSQGVDPKVHKLCIEAKDYEGCVRAMTGANTPQRVTVDQGKAEIAGFNSCPIGYRYKGNGYCGEVICKDAGMWFVGKHNPMLVGKDSWCKPSGLGSGGRLDFTGDTVRASFDPSCPDTELMPGWQNSCSQQKGPHKKGDGREAANSNCTATICS